MKNELERGIGATFSLIFNSETRLDRVPAGGSSVGLTSSFGSVKSSFSSENSTL